jgi:hypothetical protein
LALGAPVILAREQSRLLNSHRHPRELLGAQAG